MKRLLLTGLALLLVPALALAGKTATDGTDTLKIKAKFDPAKASKKQGAARSMKFSFEYLAGTTDGSRLPDLRSVSIFAGGAVLAFDAFPKCDESELVEQGPSACPPGSQVGSGSATAEVHPPTDETSKSDGPVDVTIYNAIADSDRNGEAVDKPKDGILFYTEVAGERVALPFWAEDKNRRFTYYNPEDDPVPPADNSLYTIKEVRVVFPKRTTRKDGKKVAWMAAPKKCTKAGWVVSATNDRYEGGELTATHKVKCKKAGS